jgi:hypothetical protein
MNDEQLEENLSLLVEMYLDDQQYEGNRVYTLEKDTGLMRIDFWNCVGVDKPDIETFRGRSIADINRKRRRKKRRVQVGRNVLQVLTDTERDDLQNTKVGMMIVNSTENRVQCYLSNGWASL